MLFSLRERFVRASRDLLGCSSCLKQTVIILCLSNLFLVDAHKVFGVVRFKFLKGIGQLGHFNCVATYPFTGKCFVALLRSSVQIDFIGQMAELGPDPQGSVVVRQLAETILLPAIPPMHE